MRYARRLPARAKRDARLREAIGRVHRGHFDVHGGRKMWRQLRREGVEVARCTVGRLMREMGLQVPSDSLRRPLTTAADTESGLQRFRANTEDLDLYWTNIGAYCDEFESITCTK